DHGHEGHELWISTAPIHGDRQCVLAGVLSQTVKTPAAQSPHRLARPHGFAAILCQAQLRKAQWLAPGLDLKLRAGKIDIEDPAEPVGMAARGGKQPSVFG